MEDVKSLRQWEIVCLNAVLNRNRLQSALKNTLKHVLMISIGSSLKCILISVWLVVINLSSITQWKEINHVMVIKVVNLDKYQAKMVFINALLNRNKEKYVLKNTLRHVPMILIWYSLRHSLINVKLVLLIVLLSIIKSKAKKDVKWNAIVEGMIKYLSI